MFRNGQPVRFELDESIKLVVLRTNNKVDYLAPEDPLEVELMRRKFATAADGRFVGIHVAAAKARYFDHVPITGPDGQPAQQVVERYVNMPALIVPLRALLLEDGSHHLTHVVDGKAVNVMFTLDSLRNVEALLLQEDLPAYRRATTNPDWQPRR